MTIYLIDYENVREGGFSGLNEISEAYEVHLFYSSNANRISLDALRGLKAGFAVHRVNAGKQSLDLQLVSYLGYLIAQNPLDTKYVIVSKDNGFLNTVAFWKDEKGIKVSVAPDLGAAEKKPEKAEKKPEPAKQEKTEKQDRSSRGSRRTRQNRQNRTAKPAGQEEQVQTAGQEEQVQTAGQEADMQPKDTAALPREAEQTGAPAAEIPAETKDPKENSPEAGATAAEPKQADEPKEDKLEARKNLLKAKLTAVLEEKQVEEAAAAKITAAVMTNCTDKNIKQLVYLSMIKSFGQKRGLEYYGAIKQLLKQVY